LIAKGVTASELASELGVPRSYISLMCHGYAQPSIKRLKHIEAFLGLTQGELARLYRFRKNGYQTLTYINHLKKNK